MSDYAYDVGIVGLGYVGLTLATALADVGMSVVGIEKRLEVVSAIASGRSHFRENGLEPMLNAVLSAERLRVQHDFLPNDCCRSYIITVGTPLDSEGNARLDMIENATRQVANSMAHDALVVLRSTVKIGTSREIVAPILDSSGKRYHLAMCPERTLEGNAMEELRHLPQIIGADSGEANDRARALFSRLTRQVLSVSSLETAELIKLVDNTFRDVRFGFANEVARICDAVGVSASEVIETGKLGYPRTNLAKPGLVGGPCLEKDPHILEQSGQTYGISLDITTAARRVNERQPAEGAQFIDTELKRRNVPEDAVIAILGLAFKGVPETDDLRGSMSLKVIKALQEIRPNARFKAFDPVVEIDTPIDLNGVERSPSIKQAINQAACAVIANNHPVFAKDGLSQLISGLSEGGFVYDFWNHFSEVKSNPSASYYAIGSVRRRPL
jgi:UDP-N-acetyl-D-mannosaminuronic acid dehydrogenase